MDRARQAGCGVVFLIAAVLGGCNAAMDPAAMTELQRVSSGPLDVIVLAPHDALRRGTDTFIIEFRSGGRLVDAGTLRATASMPMPSMPMFGNIQVRRTEAAGRYAATGEFDMAGTWRIVLEWEGPAGRGSVAFAGTVR